MCTLPVSRYTLFFLKMTHQVQSHNQAAHNHRHINVWQISSEIGKAKKKRQCCEFKYYGLLSSIHSKMPAIERL